MTKFLKAFIYLGASLFLFFLLREYLPKYTGALTVYLVLWILDGYLWISTRSYLRRQGRALFVVASGFYWLPFALIFAGVIYGWFHLFPEWDTILRTEYINLIQIGYAVKLFPFAARISLDAVRLVFGRPLPQIAYGRKTPLKRNRLMTSGWVLGLLTGLTLLSGHLLWQFNFRAEKVQHQINDLPHSFDGLRIVQLSDMHLGNWICERKLVEVVERVNKFNPDLIFVTGDEATFTALDVIRFQPILAKLHAREGIFVVYGNHDYGQYYKAKNPKEVYVNMDRFGRAYNELGWTLLCNEQRILIRGTDSIAILGVHNWGAEARFPKLADIIKAEQGAEHVATKFLLSHDPTFWETYISKRQPDIDLTFSGHTHGGQIGTETGKIRFSLVSMLHPYWAGLYQKTWPDGNMQYLYVNRGLGTVGYQGRIGIPPEITLFILNSPR